MAMLRKRSTEDGGRQRLMGSSKLSRACRLCWRLCEHDAAHRPHALPVGDMSPARCYSLSSVSWMSGLARMNRFVNLKFQTMFIGENPITTHSGLPLSFPSIIYIATDMHRTMWISGSFSVVEWDPFLYEAICCSSLEKCVPSAPWLTTNQPLLSRARAELWFESFTVSGTIFQVND